eukprot:Nitzschia sp. Nitz4//scaffold230_size58257//40074//43916//NITZ4_006487-RA/size58257-processed-gene-0.68-mRNA-1//-1//CDS//3329543268//8864//frame0
MYPEIRVHNGDLESSIFLAWISQIVLMELAMVPSTVGLTTADTKNASFYSPLNQMVYSNETYPVESLEMGYYTSACNSTSKPCVQSLPSVWPNKLDEYSELKESELILDPEPNGLFGYLSPYVPSFTASQYPGMTTHFGLAGEENRQLLAETFLRPTTWREYCTEVSTTGCLDPDEVSSRLPQTYEEEGRYFAEGVFTGYFRFTEQNNCTLYPTTCTGTIIAPPCDWASNVEGQLYWNNIVGLSLDGPESPHGGYTVEHLQQLWDAANATRSNIMMYWFEPSYLPVRYIGTEFEMQSVAFPQASKECVELQATKTEQCSNDVEIRRGVEGGACRSKIITLEHLIVKSLYLDGLELPEADKSPDYEVLTNVRVSSLEMNAMLKAWYDGIDPRAAVCDWVVENLDSLWGTIPDGYPRVLERRSQYQVWYLFLCQGFGTTVGVIALLGIILCFKYRETKTMVFAQPFFMMLILHGFLLVSAGAVLNAFEPTLLNCTASSWLVVLGYTIELVPVLVKTSAINRLISSSKKKMKRVNISRHLMFMQVTLFVALSLAFLITWTVLDTPDAQVLREVVENDEVIVVQQDLKCASEQSLWRLVSFGWQALLLLLAAVLAFQSRGVMTQLNDSKYLAVMVYSHFLFVSLRGICSFFYVYGTLPSSATAALFSMNYSMDALLAMGIYVFPKILEARKSPGDFRPGRFSTEFRLSRARSSIGADEPNESEDVDAFSEMKKSQVSILICTANIGNAEPTLESLEAWVPPGGTCHRVTPLDKQSLGAGNFDIIAIGMQEATWSDSRGKGSRRALKGDQITEADVLNALEQKNTAQLREMIQDTLGDGYHQVADEQRGQMRLHIWVRRPILRDITRVKLSGSNTGIGNVLANKGGIVATVYYRNTRISFISLHLAAHEGESYYKTRCENLRSILREAKTFGGTKKFDETMTSHHCFVFGDMNFRTNFGTESSHEDNMKRAMDLIDAKDYATLYQFDELQEGIAEGDLLVKFKTLPCNFPPTFKVERDVLLEYRDQRTPSYTDRILFRSAEGLATNLKPLAYESCLEFVSSDHKPIRGAFSLTPNDEMDSFKIDGELQMVFRKMRCSDLPAGDADGKSDPYLLFMWDSVDFQSDNGSIVDKIRELWLGRSWPRTPYISKTLNPFWKGTRMHFHASNTVIGPDAMLFIAAIDFDAVGKDEFLGGLSLNVMKLVGMKRSMTEKSVLIDEPLLREGKFSGRIKCSVDITMTQRVPSRLSMGLGSRLASRMTLGKLSDDGSWKASHGALASSSLFELED